MVVAAVRQLRPLAELGVGWDSRPRRALPLRALRAGAEPAMTCDWCMEPSTTLVLLERAVYSGHELRKRAILARACPNHEHLGMAPDEDQRPPLAADSLRRRRDREAEHRQLTIYDVPKAADPDSPQAP
jgi:hypothetical protein